ncbi:MAG: hypothetical protein HC941_00920 [Microcoleus sp. SU_5_3]|nr:hypothetical protein [Microcoleus sp. SU_5_3]
MLPEQQQRIMGYFIEEAKDHLNTIEQGLLNLQATIEDPELVNEVFRAAHSVKGGAAMLGLTSIQQTSHRLEDSFKVLKECSVKVDQQLESLFLRIFDTLQALLEQLSGPFGLTEEFGEQMVRELEPVFEELNGHLGGLVGQCGRDVDESSPLPVPQQVLAGIGAGAFASSNSFVDSQPAYIDSRETEESALHLVFDSDVPARMREMLQAFKQPEGRESKRQLKSICRNLKMAGEEFELPHWIELIESVEKAIANPENTYRSLAPTVIKDIKQAQELVLCGQEDEIVVGAKLRELLPAEQSFEADFEDLLAFAQPSTGDGNIHAVEEAAWDLTGTGDSSASEQLLPTISGLSIDELFDKLDGDDSEAEVGGRSPQLDDSQGLGESDVETGSFRNSLRTGPEVGAAELNTLADLFDGESHDLEDAWEEEEDLEDAVSSRVPTQGILEPDDEDNSGDFTDLLFEEYGVEHSEANAMPPIDDLTNLFGEDLMWGDSDNSAEPADREDGNLRQSLTEEQPTTNRTDDINQVDRIPPPVQGWAEEDALGTLLDEVAAQTPAPAEKAADLDNLLSELGKTDFAEIPTDSSDYLPSPNAFDRDSYEPEDGDLSLNDLENDAEALNLLEIDDFGSQSETGDDSDFSELLAITSGFLLEGQNGESRKDPGLPSNELNEEIGRSPNMTSDPNLDISSDENWLEDAFGLEDELSPSANLELDDTDLDALFGDVSSGPISSDDEIQPERQSAATAATSQEAADLAELFGSVSTGTEYDSEELAGSGTDWLTLEENSASLSADATPEEGDLASWLDGQEVVLDENLENLDAFGLEALSDGSDSQTSTTESDDSSALDLLEGMFGEEALLPDEGTSAEAEDAVVDLGELSAELPDGLFDEGGADLFEGLEIDAAGEDEDDDLFDSLETDVSASDLDAMSAEVPDEMFEGDVDLLSALETGQLWAAKT